MNDIENRIMQNLKGRVWPVNEFVALSGVEFSQGYAALQSLIEAGAVNVSRITIPDGEFLLERKMYLLSYEERLRNNLEPVT